MVTEDRKQQIRIKNPVTTQLEFDPAVKGDLKDLVIDPTCSWIAATFENGSITIFSRQMLASTYEIVPHHIQQKDLGS